MDHKQDTEPLLPAADEWCRQGLAAAEAKRLVRLAGPMITSCLLQNIINIMSLMFVGHLGELPLAGASLANSVASVTGFSIIIGMATALDTLCGQAYGARQHHLLGVYKQRAMVVLGLTCVPIAVVWAHTGRILVLLGQDPRIAAEAGAYARWLIPSLAVSVPLQCHVRFLQAQSLVLPVTASSAAAALCHLAVCWALVFKAGMGAKGAALSNAISYAVNLVMLSLYVRLSSSCRDTWNGFSMEGFKDLRKFADLAVPSAMMICLEWWAFETLVLLSGLLPNPQLETSVLSICLNTGILLFMIPSGLGYSVSTRVSNELGAGQPQAAKLATRVVVCIALFLGFVLTLGMTLLRHVWGYMYSNEPEVVAYIAKMLPVLGISFFIDGLHGSLSGVLTGCGKQKIGATVNLGAFYLAGIPMAVLLAFVFHLNGMGLWLGIVCGSLIKVLLFASVTWTIDWSMEATKAKDRVFGSSLPVA
ncbi:protein DETOXIFICATION 16-like [Triticum urartu]|nr:protein DETOXIFICATION 16-like [Triticum urartu]